MANQKEINKRFSELLEKLKCSENQISELRAEISALNSEINDLILENEELRFKAGLKSNCDF